MNKNGKNKFYRTLNLDKKTKQILRDFNKIKQEMINDGLKEQEGEKDDIL